MKSHKKGIMQVTDAQIGWGMALIGIVFVGVAYMAITQMITPTASQLSML